jgi:hypothetical protein
MQALSRSSGGPGERPQKVPTAACVILTVSNPFRGNGGPTFWGECAQAHGELSDTEPDS